MDILTKNKIYDRLLAIRVNIETSGIPGPNYINAKIGECHVYIDETEKFSIRVSKEISVMQRAYNNSTARYETAREDLITKDEEIKTLPSIRDREAKANSLLKAEIDEIKTSQNELSDLNNLLKAISLKLKNLGRTNSDIKTQLRVMESQIKLGTPPESDAVAKSLAEELRKSNFGEDSFADVETSVKETEIVDPSEPLDIDNLLKDDEDSEGEEEISEKLLEPVPGVNPEGARCSSWEAGDFSEGIKKEAEESIVESEEQKVDLDAVIENPEKGGIEKTKILEPKNVPGQDTPKIQKTKNTDDIDIDSLLDNIK